MSSYICQNLCAVPYNITITTGLMSVEYDNGDTAAFNLDESCSAKVGVERRPVHQAVAEPGAMAIVFQENHFVLVRFADASEPYRIWMGQVDNQGTWANTQAGANNCVAAIAAAFA